MAALLLLEAAAHALAADPTLDDVAVPSVSPVRADAYDGSADDRASSDAGDSDSSSGRSRIARGRPQSSTAKPYARSGRRDAEAHNVVERRRRAELSAGYDRLRALLPALATVAKVSNAVILDAAVDEAQRLTQRARELEAALVAERDRHARLVRAATGRGPASSPPRRAARAARRRGGDASSEEEGLVPSLGPAKTVARKDGFQTAPGTPEPLPSPGDEHELAYGLLMLAEISRCRAPKMDAPPSFLDDLLVA